MRHFPTRIRTTTISITTTVIHIAALSVSVNNKIYDITIFIKLPNKIELY